MHQKARTEYRQLKGSMIQRGYTLRSWALKKGYCVTTVYGAARGDRSGILSIKIQKELEEFIK